MAAKQATTIADANQEILTKIDAFQQAVQTQIDAVQNAVIGELKKLAEISAASAKAPRARTSTGAAGEGAARKKPEARPNTLSKFLSMLYRTQYDATHARFRAIFENNVKDSDAYKTADEDKKKMVEAVAVYGYLRTHTTCPEYVKLEEEFAVYKKSIQTEEGAPEESERGGSVSAKDALEHAATDVARKRGAPPRAPRATSASPSKTANKRQSSSAAAAINPDAIPPEEDAD